MEKLIECMLNEGIDEETIINVVEEYLNETFSPLPKKAIESGNKKFTEKDSENNLLNRLYKKANKKLNDEVKKYENKWGKGSVDHIDPYWIKHNPSKGAINYDLSKALKTVLNLDKKRDISRKEFDDINNSQRKLASENPGVIYREPTFYRTKKHDSFSWANKKKTSESLSESCFNDIIDIVETLVGKYKEKGIPVTSYNKKHGKNISNTDIKNEIKGEVYPKKAIKHLDNALKNQGEEERINNSGRDLDDTEPWRKMTKLKNKIENDKQIADMYMGKAYVTGKVTNKAWDEYTKKRGQIK